jgi:hypothetical protein
MRKQLGLVMAREELENEGTTTVVVETAPADHAELVETDLIDVADAGADVEVSGAEVDEGIEAVGDMEELAETAEVAAAEGRGFDATAYAIAGRYAADLRARAGVVAANTTLAAESFDNVAGRSRATKLAAEGWAEDAKKMASKIYEFIKGLWDKMVKYFESVFSAADKLKKRAEETKAKLKDIKGAPGTEKIEAEGIVSALYVSSGDLKASEGSAVLVKVAEATAATFADVTGSAATAVIAALKEKSDFEAATQTFRDAAIGKFNADVADPAKHDLPAEDGVTYQAASKEVLPGNKLFVVKTTAAKDAVATYSFVRATGDKSFTAPKDFTPIDAAEAGKVLDDVIAIVDSVMKMKDALKAGVKQKDALLAAAKELEKAKDITEEEAKKTAKAQSTYLMQLSGMLTEPAKSFNEYAVRTCKSYLDLVEKSLKTFKA